MMNSEYYESHEKFTTPQLYPPEREPFRPRVLTMKEQRKDVLDSEKERETQWRENRNFGNKQIGHLNNNNNNNNSSNNNNMDDCRRKGQEDLKSLQEIGSTTRMSKKEKTKCQVCGDIAAGFYCGAYICEACKKFFVRSTKLKHPHYTCLNQERCDITKNSRMHCQFCRYQKCLKLNMSYTEKGKHPKTSGIKELPCRVCSALSSGFHFGAITCEGCKNFFRRVVKEKDSVEPRCMKQGNCEISFKMRTDCKACRYQKCLSVGMSGTASRIGRHPNSFKHTISLEAKKLVSLRESNKVQEEDTTRESHIDHGKKQVETFRRESSVCSQQTVLKRPESEYKKYDNETLLENEIHGDNIPRKKHSPSFSSLELVRNNFDKTKDSDRLTTVLTKCQFGNWESKIPSDFTQSYRKTESPLYSVAERNIAPFMKRQISHEPLTMYGKGDNIFNTSFESRMNAIYTFPDSLRYKGDAFCDVWCPNSQQKDYDIKMNNLYPNTYQSFYGNRAPLSPMNKYLREKELLLSERFYNMSTQNDSFYYPDDSTSTNRLPMELGEAKTGPNSPRKYFVHNYDDLDYHHQNGNRHTSDARVVARFHDHADNKGVFKHLNQDQNDSQPMNYDHSMRSDNASISSFLQDKDSYTISPPHKKRFKPSIESYEDFRDISFAGDDMGKMLSRAANELSHMCISERAKSGIFDEESYSTVDKTWIRMMKHFEFHAKCVVRFVKRIPKFRDLKIEDQISLLQRNTYPLLVLNQGRTFEPDTGFVNYFNFTQKEEQRVMELFPELSILRSHFLHSGYMANYLKLTDIEYAYLSCLCVLTNDDYGRDDDKILELKEFYVQYFYESGYHKKEIRFDEMLLRVSEFSLFANQHDKAIGQILKKHCQLHIPTLFSEMYQ